jgi:hypothetical protein
MTVHHVDAWTTTLEVVVLGGFIVLGIAHIIWPDDFDNRYGHLTKKNPWAVRAMGLLCAGFAAYMLVFLLRHPIYK